MAKRIAGRTTGLLLTFSFLAACEGGPQDFINNLRTNPDAVTTGSAPEAPVSGPTRDVEAPEVFEAADAGLWDGRPSLGGVWVAHPDVKDPERAIIRNNANGKFVIGALFRREREAPGPTIQVSSDAAKELGLLAGQPAVLNVIALRKEAAPAALVAPDAEAENTVAMPEPGEIDSEGLDTISASAAAAIAAAEADASAEPEAPEIAAAPEPAPEPAAPQSNLEKPFLQIGIFSEKQNAENAAASLRTAGVVPTVLEQTTQGKTFWRVIVGPSTSKSSRSAVLAKVKEIGYADAYPVTN